MIVIDGINYYPVSEVFNGTIVLGIISGLGLFGLMCLLEKLLK